MIALIPLILNALIAIPKICEYVEKAVQAIILWQIQRQQSETLKKIADAAAFSARAKTDEDRFKAAEMWRDALSRPRVS